MHPDVASCASFANPCPVQSVSVPSNLNARHGCYEPRALTRPLLNTVDWSGIGKFGWGGPDGARELPAQSTTPSTSSPHAQLRQLHVRAGKVPEEGLLVARVLLRQGSRLGGLGVWVGARGAAALHCLPTEQDECRLSTDHDSWSADGALATHNISAHLVAGGTLLLPHTIPQLWVVGGTFLLPHTIPHLGGGWQLAPSPHLYPPHTWMMGSSSLLSGSIMNPHTPG